MSSQKNINSSTLIVGGIVLVAVGFIFGLLVNDFPYVTFNRQVDMGNIISAFAFVATIFILPFVINKSLSRIDHKNQIIISDIDDIIKFVDDLSRVFQALPTGKPLSKANWLKIIPGFRTISSRLTVLSDELDSHKILGLFRKEIFTELYEDAYQKGTGSIVINELVDNIVILETTNSLNKLAAKLKSYRYKVH